MHIIICNFTSDTHTEMHIIYYICHFQRSCVLKWLAAVALDLGSANLPLYLESMLVPVHREISDQSSGK